MVIDIHAHVYRWPVLKKRNNGLPMMSAEEQVRRMDEKGIDKAVILPLTSAEVIGEPQSMGEVFDICRLYPGRFIPFCDFDVRRYDLDSVEAFRDVLDQYVARGAKGVGELTSRVYWDDPRLWNLFTACEDLGLPVTFHTSPPEVVTYGLIDELGFPRFEKALQRFPSLRFFGHSASFWSEISGDLTADGKEGYPRTPVAPWRNPGPAVQDLSQPVWRPVGGLRIQCPDPRSGLHLRVPGRIPGPPVARTRSHGRRARFPAYRVAPRPAGRGAHHPRCVREDPLAQRRPDPRTGHRGWELITGVP